MSNQQQLTNLIKSISGQANILTIPRVYISFCGGDLAAALLLSQIVYWSDRSARTDGWFYKSFREWEEETSLTQFQVSRATSKFKSAGFLIVERKMANGHPTLHYRLDMEMFTQCIIKFLDNEETSQSIMKKLDNPLSSNLIIHYEETSQSLTETTTEITTETTTKEYQEGSADPHDLMSRMIERLTGAPVRPADEKAIKQMVDEGVIEDDIRAALQWRKDNGYNPVCGAAQLLNGILRNKRNRVQGANAKPGKPRPAAPAPDEAPAGFVMYHAGDPL